MNFCFNRNFRNSITEVGRISTYVKIILILAAYSVCVQFLDFSPFVSFFCGVPQLIVLCIFMIVFDIYFLIASSCYLWRIGKSHDLSERNRFQYEKNWFWMAVGVLGIMIITWPIEILSWNKEYYSSLHLSLISDGTKLFSAVNLFVIFIMRKNVKQLILNKYRAVRDGNVDI